MHYFKSFFFSSYWAGYAQSPAVHGLKLKQGLTSQIPRPVLSDHSARISDTTLTATVQTIVRIRLSLQ